MIFNPGNQKEISSSVWEELIKEVDLNGDGKVTIIGIWMDDVILRV